MRKMVFKLNYLTLNENQRKRINQICSTNYKFAWEDAIIIDTLVGKLPKIRHYSDETNIKKEVKQLEEYYYKYNFFRVDRTRFIQDIKKMVNSIQEKDKYWYGVDPSQITTCIRLQEFCLISGEGGIGKSFFIKCLEEKIETLNIPHLCIYGKFKKDFKDFDIDEILSVSDKGFIFIVDAINELSSAGQLELLYILKKMTCYPGIRIILTYRKKAIDEKILKQYQDIAKYEYNFRGVSYESALNELLKLNVPDIYKYEDILFSNNALLLNMLLDILRCNKIVYEQENSLNLITFILETYVKQYIREIHKKELNIVDPKIIWKDVKRVATWMYQHEIKEIDEKNLLSIVKSGSVFINVLSQAGIINSLENNGKIVYSFGIDLLTDFLIARSLFADIDKKTYEECKEIIIKKTEKLYSIKEAVILITFDKFSPCYEYIKKLLIDTNLIASFDYETILKIRFNKIDSSNVSKVFDMFCNDDLLIYFGGYTDKPFNCVNYINSYYKKGDNQLNKLSKTLSGTHYFGRVKERLKNIIYFITLNNKKDRRDEEAFYFAFWCCASPNQDIRCLAMKLLYETLQKNNKYKNILISLYNETKDFYIKESIIYVLISFHKGDKDIEIFLDNLIKNEKNLVDKSIKRIATYLGDEYGYIKWQRDNLCCKNTQNVSDEFINNLVYIDLMDKEFLPFRYYFRDHVTMYTKFLDIDKQKIEKLNLELREKYLCVKDGDCNGSVTLEKYILSEFKLDYNNKILSNNIILASLEVVAKKIFSLYGGSYDEKKYVGDSTNFKNSIYRKCMEISIGLLYGSLMCNYYTSQFVAYNNSQNSIGYELFDPIKEGEDIYLTTPISTYQDFVEQLGDLVVERIRLPEEKNIGWAKDVLFTSENLQSVLKPIVKGKTEWIMLGGRISIFEKNKKNDKEWVDSYNIWCCTSSEESIFEYTDCDYLTINPDYYTDNIYDYKKCSTKPWLCKSINNIDGRSEIFDETSLVLPPAELINYFDLTPNNSNASWVNDKNEIVIYCNNNKKSYYKDLIQSTIFIRKDYFDIFIENNMLKYFAFTERFIPETGYANETSLHFELINNKITKQFMNEKMYEKRITKNPLCKKCPHGFVEDVANNESMIDYLEIIFGNGYRKSKDD